MPRVAHNKTHGMTGTPIYGVWLAMRRRCTDPKVKCYPDYDGRGIKVCERWASSFDVFMKDMGLRPPGHTIERRDNPGDYEPGNCFWATRDEQAANKRNNRMLTAHGCTQTMQAWAEALGVSHTAILYRLRQGWPVERAVTEPAPERPNGKLTIEQAQWALDNYPAMSAPKIGKVLGVSGTSILNIVKGCTFAGLNREATAQAATA